ISSHREYGRDGMTMGPTNAEGNNVDSFSSESTAQTPDHPLVVETEERIIGVRLNRPDKHNGMNLEMLNAVDRTAKQLATNKTLRAVTICGNGPSFCAGLDFASILGAPIKAAPTIAQLWLPFTNRFQHWS